MNRLFSSASAVCAFALSVAPATAQQAAAIQLPDITVSGGGGAAASGGLSKDQSATGPIDDFVAHTSATATKTATPIIETPQSISVVGQQQIRQLNEQTISDTLTYVSGVRGDTFGNDTRNDFFTIRGFPAQIDGYFLDGLQLRSPGFGTFSLEPFDLERLEVLKGPASVLYGGSNTGGIINGVSKRPITDGKQHGYLETGIDNFGNAYGAFDLSGPVSQKPDNKFYYRLVGLARGGGTQVDYTNNNRFLIAPSLTWAPDAQTRVTFLSSYQKDDTKGQNFLPYEGTVTPAPFGRISTSLFTSDPQLDTFQRNQAFVGYSAEHYFTDNFVVRQNLRYSDLRITDRTLYGIGYDGNPANAELSRFNFIADPHVQELAVDTSAEARFHTGVLAHDAIFGVDYKHFVDFDSDGYQLGPDFNLLNPNYYTGTTSPTSRYSIFRDTEDQVGEYLQDQIKLGKFTLVLSGRHDTLFTDYNNIQTPSQSATTTNDALTGRVGLIYTSDLGIAPYVTAATSFDPQLGYNVRTGTNLVPETGVLEEVGIKYQPVGKNFTFSGALFNLTETNVPTTDPLTFQTFQTGQENSKGFELEAAGHITDGLKVLASYTGYRLRDTEDVNPALIGTVPTNIPQNFGALFLDYTIQTGFLRGLGGGAGPRFVGASFASNDNTYAVPSVVLADANIHYDHGPWRAALNVRNVFDKTYVSGCSSTSACFYGVRRQALFSLAYRW